MKLKKLITDTLSNTKVPNIEKILQYMEDNFFFECRSSSHNHWRGGTAQHVWAVYLIAKALRNQRKDDPIIAKYATDKKLALVCLLHDICDMNVRVRTNWNEDVSHRHGRKSCWIMRNLNVGTEIERMVVRNHMHSDRDYQSDCQQETDEYNALHDLITKADHQASGTAWNCIRFKNGQTQHYGVHTEDQSYLRAVAMDRTVQSGKYHLYMDENYELREYRNYNNKSIKWNDGEDLISNLNDDSIKIKMDGASDVITAAHDHIRKTGEKLCIVLGVNSAIPNDKDTRLRRGWKDEQDILICSNLLNTFYESKKSEDNGKKRFRFEFTMRDVIKEHYRDLQNQNGGIYMPEVKMIRDGESRGFPFVEPWIVDILLIPHRKFPMFATRLHLETRNSH